MIGIDQNEHFETAGIGEVRQVARALIGRTKPIGDAESGEDRRNHDRQHDAQCVEQDLPFGGGNLSLRIEDAFCAAAEYCEAD
jgi:hypothetical protein